VLGRLVEGGRRLECGSSRDRTTGFAGEPVSRT
jgi:hypothetical protein